MATFAEYQSQTMAPNNDFTLYSYPDMWNNDPNFLPISTYPDGSFASGTTMDSYQSHLAFSQPEQYTFGNDPSYHSKQSLQAPNSHYSPSNSASHQSIDLQHPPILSSTSDSGASVQSTISSVMGSPSVHPQLSSDWQQQGMELLPTIAQHGMFATTGFGYDPNPATTKDCVDPALIGGYSPNFAGHQFPDMAMVQSPQMNVYPAPSPAPSHPVGKIRASASPRPQTSYPYPIPHNSRRQSIASAAHSPSQGSIASDDSNKGLCPIATCGRHVKDLKAHMLTHQNERPEKCPIPTCEYHTKGFARKYDKNRHTLTHYKGTMVCGFCPGSGSAAEKSFNRADVFKRHLTSVHGVEQTPPNARRKSPAAASTHKSFGREVSGMCSTCGVTFACAQDFYEHLDDCVLRVVQQADPSEAINEKILTSMADDQQTQETLEKHMLPTGVDYEAPASFEEDDGAEDDEEEEDDDANDGTYGSRSSKSGKGAIGSQKDDCSRPSMHPRTASNQHVSASGAVSKPLRKGLTLSKNGVALTAINGKGSKRRKNYPLSWGAAPEKMKMKKRVLCVYDGQRRLWKDDMMLDAEHEVRIPLNDEIGVNRAWVTDLDIQTIRRAEALHDATPEEKGPWLEDDELEKLMA